MEKFIAECTKDNLILLLKYAELTKKQEAEARKELKKVEAILAS